MTDDDVDHFRRLRNGLRRLAALLTDDARAAAASSTRDVADAIAEVNNAAAISPATPRLHLLAGVLRRETPPSATATKDALSTVAAEAIELLTGEAGPRLRACHGPGCVLYFVKDHPRCAWCSATCGNRARAARHYRRRHPHRPDGLARAP